MVHRSLSLFLSLAFAIPLTSDQNGAAFVHFAKDGSRSVSMALKPGVVSALDDRWMASEDLSHLPDPVLLEVEFTTPQDRSLPIGSADLRLVVERELKMAKIQLKKFSHSKADLQSFLHLLVVVYPLEENYLIYAALRLMEPVVNLRAAPKKDDSHPSKEKKWQAITWEHQTLFVTGRYEFCHQLKERVAALAVSFRKEVEKERKEEVKSVVPTTKFSPIKRKPLPPLHPVKPKASTTPSTLPQNSNNSFPSYNPLRQSNSNAFPSYNPPGY